MAAGRLSKEDEVAVHWLVQIPPDDSPTIGRIKAACEALGLGFRGIPVEAGVRPVLPEPAGPTIVQGRWTLIQAARQDSRYHASVFFEPESFRPSSAIAAWGARHVNAAGVVRSWDEALAEFPARGSLFIRPDDDSKLFTGRVFQREDFASLHSEAVSRGIPERSPALLVAPIRELDAELRLFIVERQVVGASSYRPGGMPMPNEVIHLGEELAAQWSPAPAFVLDIGRIDRGWSVVEVNCINGCRFYTADVPAIVTALSELCRRTFDEPDWRLTAAPAAESCPIVGGRRTAQSPSQTHRQSARGSIDQS